MQRIIFHVDVNSAFLSWEAAKRVREGEQDIRLIPAAIGGDRDKRTGVILAKSIPAKKYGVTTGEPVAMALRKCPDLFLAKPDFRLYERNSRAFMDICRKYAPAVEKYSIDECFLDMTGTEKLYGDPVDIARRIKDEIRDTLGFTVNIGVANNKLLAKMASDFEKPDKVHTLFDGEIREKLWPLRVGELFTVGPATARKLEQAGITTIGALAKASLLSIQALLGQKMGRQVWEYANGRDESSVLTEAEEAKGYSISTTTEEDVVTAEQAYKILLALADSVAARMRSEGAKAYGVSVTIRGNDFKNRSHQKKLTEPTDITNEIYKLCRSLFDELWDKHTPLRLLGIGLLNVTKEEYAQQCMFCDEGKDRARKLDRAVDDIRGRFGADTIMRGSVMGSGANVGKKYKAHMENKREE